MDSYALPEVIYLVRTRGELPNCSGLTIYGEVNGLFLVHGAEEDVLRLTQLGCGVFPLSESVSAPGGTPRTWQPLTTADPLIEEMVESVAWEDLSALIQWLVDFGTRYSLALNNDQVASQIGSVFLGYGLIPEYHSFQYSGETLLNVLATQTGTVYPDSFFIICGHFDSVSGDPYLIAPGADDNGTGTAMVLLAADILSGYSFRYSIIYICFNGEEQGLKGSQAYAAWASANDLGIVGVLNFDMLGYWEPGVEADLEVETNDASVWLAEAVLNAADLYTETPYELHVYNGAWWGDHASFWGEGFPAVNHEEAWDWGDPDFNPYYHTTEDLPEYIGEDFMTGNARLGIAALATLAQPDAVGTSVEEHSGVPTQFVSLRAFPNPFSDQINFQIDGAVSQDQVLIDIFDLSGRLVTTMNVPLVQGSGSGCWIPCRGKDQEGFFAARIHGSENAGTARFAWIR